MKGIERRDLCNRIERTLERSRQVEQVELVRPPLGQGGQQLPMLVPGVARRDYDHLVGLLREALEVLQQRQGTGE